MLALDLGNSALKAAVFDSDGCLITPHRFAWKDDGVRRFADWLGTQAVGPVGLASVVPRHTGPVTRVLSEAGWPVPLRLHAGTPLPLRIAYATPGTLGADRLAAALAAFTRYGGTRPIVALDAGTALTYEVVDARGVYLGGAIAPGADVLVRGLSTATAQLPPVPFRLPPSPIGDTTQHALQAGIVFGWLDGVAGMLGRIEAVLGEAPFVAATGGQADWLARHLDRIDAVRPHLVLEGIREAVRWQQRRS